MKNVSNWLQSLLTRDRCLFSVKGLYSQKDANRLCIFASFDPDGKIKPDVVKYIRELKHLGFDIIYVTTSNCARDEFKKITHYCRLMISRKNVGYDFYSWKTGLKYASDLDKYEKLLLANDSVVGPFFPLSPIFEKMDKNPDYVWGLTDSYERNVHHLQSYFLYFNRKTFNTRLFRKFWRRVRILSEKKEIVTRYELGLSKAIVDAGIPIRAVVPYIRLKEKVQEVGPRCKYYQMVLSKNINPTLYLWDILIKDFNFPFIKKQLFRKNHNIPVSIKKWKRVVSHGDIEVIKTACLFEKGTSRK